MFHFKQLTQLLFSCYDSENKECGGDASGVEDIVRNMKAVERAVLGFM